ncbi:stAR-related lipid transfer protein 13 isoform X1 [Pygocentrus nattereri]|uniref:StAR-related lipid transfer protein 13 n=2 Tax=Pygocentrus nattereri TaxID=42514 RepID=A0A3B4DLC1_PYGNA|nr:stAR-related lipid transfer protein 13 isoform X1 [Pygocentrus nattereri]
MEALSMVTLEGQPTSATPLTPKMTFSALKSTAGMTEDGNKTMRNISSENVVNVAPEKQENAERNVENEDFIQSEHACAPQDSKLGSILNLPTLTKEYNYTTGNTVIENKDDLNGCCYGSDFVCLLQEDNQAVLFSDGPTLNGHAVDTVANSKPLCPVCSSKMSSQVDHTHLPMNSSLPSDPLSSTAPSNEAGELPRIIKHKPSSITFADYTFLPASVQGVHESSDSGESSSSEEEDDDDDNVFTQMPQNRETVLTSRRRRGGRRQGIVGEAAKWDPDSNARLGTGGYEGEGESNSHEESPLVLLSPWSESMTQLMKKLDQLNLDIEEALSAGSSPSDTPGTTRRHTANDKTSQQSAAALGTEGKQSLINMARGPEWKECHGQGIFSTDTSSVTRTCPRKAEMSIKTKRGGAEIEAKEACDWLRAAGFPQYAQLFEDSQFPIDISPVKKDHDFLDKDLVEPLCRRLNTLNKCASLKLDVNLPKKKSEDSDEDDLFAISDKWTFEWTSRRWSRLQDIDCLLESVEHEERPEDCALRTTPSSESVLTDLSEPEVSSLHSESSSGGVRGHSAEDSDGSHHSRSDSAATMPDRTSLGVAHHARSHLGSGGSHHTCSDPATMHENTSLVVANLPPDLPCYGSLPIKHGKRGRARAKDFLQRMEVLRSRGTLSGGRRTLVIGAPVLQHEPETVKALRCVEINVNGDGGLPEPPSSAGLQSSSDGSSSQSSTPSLKDRKAIRNDHKRSGMYLEDLDVFSSVVQGKRVAEQNRRNELHSYEDLVVHIPKDHKPGTFPKALSIESLSPTAAPISRLPEVQRQPSIKEPRPITQCCSRGSRISIYDNVPGSHLYASTGDLIDLEKEDLFPHLDDILQHVNGLQQIVDHWSKNVLPTGESAEKGQKGEVDGNIQSSSHITLDLEGHSMLEGQATPSDGDRDAISLNETESTGMRERRDSGVGASLTRPNRLRWPSFQISNRLSHSVASLQITNQSAGQLSLLQKFSLLRLTAIMEKYSMSNKHGWTWSVPKFMKRMKVPDYKDKNVFGVPLIVHVQRFGQPLPLGLQQALRYLRSQCLDQVGLFRKSGVKSRIQALRQMNESSPEDVNYEDQSAYDVADMVKQFFRDLPEPLLTSKLGETFLHIYQYVPKDQRLQAVQAAIMLMSDENREVLQTLLCFLSDVTSSVQENQMTPMNIAVCLAPSLFHLNILKKDNLSPRAMQKKYATGRPDQKDLNENLAATQGLAHMITECNRLFEIPHEMVTQSRNSYVEAELQAPTLEELCKQQHPQQEEEEEEVSWPAHLETRLQSLFKEARDKAKGWVSCQSADNTELSYKKVGDGNPLRRWRVSVEVEAPPSVVLNRVLRERHLWDVDLLQWKVCEALDKQTEIFQYVLNRMPPHPSRDFIVLRSWRTDLPRGACSLVSVSIEHDCPLLGGVRGIVLESNYLLEPCGSGKSRLTHICRVDLKGRTPEWYNKAFGHLCAAEAARIRNSFQPIHAEGPETKI